MAEYFYHREKDYEDWCKKNDNGYVFNRAGGKTGNVLHIVGGCRHLASPRYIGTYTTRYPKYCSENLTDIMNTVDVESEPHGWRYCSNCFGKV
jgi:hypothetical protein